MDRDLADSMRVIAVAAVARVQWATLLTPEEIEPIKERAWERDVNK